MVIMRKKSAWQELCSWSSLSASESTEHSIPPLIEVKINIDSSTEFRYEKDDGGSSAEALPDEGKGLRRASPGSLAYVVLYGESPELSALRKQIVDVDMPRFPRFLETTGVRVRASRQVQLGIIKPTCTVHVCSTIPSNLDMSASFSPRPQPNV